MATRTGSGVINNYGVFVYSWSGLLNGDVGSGAGAPGLVDRSIQLTGTWGVGGKVQITGSNDGGNTWAVLHDQSGNLLNNITSTDTIKLLAEGALLVRPEVVGGDGTTNLSAYLTAARAK